MPDERGEISSAGNSRVEFRAEGRFGGRRSGFFESGSSGKSHGPDVAGHGARSVMELWLWTLFLLILYYGLPLGLIYGEILDR